jgi:hypothetical protein
MKTVIAVGLLAALAVIQAQNVSVDKPHVESTPRIVFVQDGDRVLMVKGKVANEIRVWMVMEAHNGREWPTRGFDPSYTRIVTDYKPMMQKLPTGAWEIGFTSEIAEKIP